jgi:hypothetical protein
MVKGCRKSVVMICPERDSIFEAAYFVLRSDGSASETSNEGIISEANKIIEKNLISDDDSAKSKRKNDKKNLKKKFIPFAVGATVGTAAGLIWQFL